MEMFHFNPIPLTKDTRKFFTSLETLHIYNKGDEEFREEKYHKRIIHYEIEYTQKKKVDHRLKRLITSKTHFNCKYCVINITFSFT